MNRNNTCPNENCWKYCFMCKNYYWGQYKPDRDGMCENFKLYNTVLFT